ncbi:MAG: TIR domain-containing protein [Snowella sp.]|nr:TIR domain-containing protein [Snowella sp.]
MKKTILILVANPQGSAGLNLLPEVRNLQEAIQRSLNRERFAVEWRVAVQEEDLRRHILDIKPQIIHFCGHGTKEGLVIHDENNQVKLLSNEFLVDLLKNFSDRVECLVLNSCNTEPLAIEVAKHINYAIGMNQEVKDKSAIAFSEAFYDAIGAGEGIEKAFDIGKNAVLGITSSDNQSRKLTAVREDDSPFISQNKEYLIPVLYKNQNLAPLSSQSNQDFEFDAYISYVDKDPDSTWVWDVLLPKLEEAGLHIAVSGDSANPGVPRVIDIEQGIKQSKRTIVVLSKNYLLDNMTTFESALGQSMGIQEGSYRLLPVKIMSLDGIELPVRLSMLTILELSHPRRAEREFQRLVQSLKSPLPNMGQ